MRPALGLEQVFHEALRSADLESLLSERIVSLIFATPTARLWKELKSSIDYLNAQSGPGWDLFFIGIPVGDGVRPSRNWARRFCPHSFKAAADQVRRSHANALIADGMAANTAFQVAWRHSGGADLVNLMVYAGNPDWLSLHSVRLEGADSIGLTLAELSARQVLLVEGDIDRELSPGLPDALRQEDRTIGLTLAVKSLVGVVSGGMAGNAAYDLMQSLFRNH